MGEGAAVRSVRSLSALAESGFTRDTAVSIGKFDGVHLGHRKVLQQLQAAAAERDLDTAVFTFTENPLAAIAPLRCPQPLSSPEQRLALLESLGIDATVMVDFDDTLRNLSPETYVREVLVGMMRAKYVQVGRDFRFGRGGVGDVSLLEQLGAQYGLEVAISDDVTMAGERVSSSRIRDLLSRGDVAGARELLGRDVAVRGEIVPGDQRGRLLGFPTANYGAHEGLAPADGVYAGFAEVDGSAWMASISVGGNPTFTPEAESRVEVHLLDFEGDLYGKTVTTRFVAWLRPTEKFASVEALLTAIRHDVARTRAVLKSVID